MKKSIIFSAFAAAAMFVSSAAFAQSPHVGAGTSITSDGYTLQISGLGSNASATGKLTFDISFDAVCYNNGGNEVARHSRRGQSTSDKTGYTGKEKSGNVLLMWEPLDFDISVEGIATNCPNSLVVENVVITGATATYSGTTKKGDFGPIEESVDAYISL
jgi:hypothetical protein